MKTITVEIINEKALKLLKELETLKLIRLKKSKSGSKKSTIDWSKYKGSMSKQPIEEVNRQLKNLRNEWN